MKKIIVLVLSVIFSVCLLAPSAQAATFVFPGESNQNTTTIDSEINKTLIVSGENVFVDSVIPKDLIALTGNLTTNNQIGGNLLSLSKTTYIKQEIAGSAIILSSDAIISQPIKGNLYAGASDITIDTEIQGDVFVASENLTLTKNAHILGDTYARVKTLDKNDLALIDGKNDFKYYKTEKNWTDNIARAIIGFFTLMLLALIIWRFKPKTFDTIQNAMTKKWGTSLLFGLIFLIVTPIIAIAILPFIITWPISILIITAYCFIIGLSPIFASYTWVNKILKLKFHPLATIAIGLILLTIIKIIPVIGGFILFGALLFGIGASVIVIYEKIKTNPQGGK